MWYLTSSLFFFTAQMRKRLWGVCLLKDICLYMFVYTSMCIYLCVYINIMFCLCVQFVLRLIWLFCNSVLRFPFVFVLSCLYLQIEKCLFMSWQFVRTVLFRRHTLEQLEMRHSDVRKELVTLKEALSQMTLQKEVLEDEKSSLAQALSRVLLYTFTQNAHSLTCPLLHSSIYSHSFVPSHSLTCSLINSLTPSLFHTLTHFHFSNTVTH